MVTAQEFIAHVSTKPWSDWTEADYSLEQWHKACLIHLHDGPPTSKDQCKLPVRTPDGVLNKFGVIAAAAVLDGARAPIDAPADKKKAAAKALVGLYKEIGSMSPVKLRELAQSSMVDDFLEHHGVKGMHWGIRKARVKKGKSAKQKKTQYKKPAHHLSEAELARRIRRLDMEKRYNELNAPTVSAGRHYVKGILENSGKTAAGAVAGGAATFFIQRALRARFPV